MINMMQQNCPGKQSKSQVKRRLLSFDEFQEEDEISEHTDDGENSISSESPLPVWQKQSDNLLRPKKIGDLTQNRFDAEYFEDARLKKSLVEKFVNYADDGMDVGSKRTGANSGSSILYSMDGTSKSYSSPPSLKVIAYVAALQGRRPTMEDAAIIITGFLNKDVNYYAVFDGHNGSQASLYAKTYLHRLISLYANPEKKSLFLENDNEDPKKTTSIPPSCPTLSYRFSQLSDIESIMRQSFRELDNNYERAFPNAEDGSTALVCIQDGNVLHLAHIGDTRAVLGTLMLAFPLLSSANNSEKSRTSVSSTPEAQLNLLRTFPKNSSPSHLLGEDTSSEDAEEPTGLTPPTFYADADIQKENSERMIAIDLLTDLDNSTTSRNVNKQSSASNSDGQLRSVPTHSKICSIRLTRDHKPNRADEHARIERCGGHVIHSGCYRVGVVSLPYWLAVSRAFGNFLLKRCNEEIISCDPEYSCRHLTAYEDQFLLLASDGLWDVFSDEEACSIVYSLLKSFSTTTSEDDKALRHVTQQMLQHAGNQLVKLAFERGAEDNITCIILAFEWGTS